MPVDAGYDTDRRAACARVLRRYAEGHGDRCLGLVGAAKQLVASGEITAVEVSWALRCHPSTVYRRFAEWQALASGADLDTAAALGREHEAAALEILQALRSLQASEGNAT